MAAGRSMAERILIIDDDPNIVSMLQMILRGKSYDISTANNGEVGLEKYHDFQPQLILLDIMMPNMDGWETCRHLREISSVPIIMLTALGKKDDIVRGLLMGADDYVVKPFHPDELRARVEAVLRRSRSPQSSANGLICFNGGKLVIDEPNRQLYLENQPIELTPTEFNLLFFMAKHPGRILATNTIFDQVWPYDSEAGPEIVKWYIWRIRNKIEEKTNQPEYIITERGIGYRFIEADD
jgi:DNA-binding response OmpR family regulator